MTDTGAEGFAGFPPETVEFYRELAADNRREWLDANKQRYEDDVLRPARRFVTEAGSRLRELVPEIRFDPGPTNGTGSIFRIYRDQRFARGKGPLKTNLGLLFWLDDGRGKRLCPHFYVGVYVDRAVVHSGLTALPSPLLDRFRRAVADERTGEPLRRLLDDLEAAGFETGAPDLKRVPAPYPSDHPRADLLRRRGVFAERSLAESLVTSSRFLDECLAAFTRTAPLVTWLSAALGKD